MPTTGANERRPSRGNLLVLNPKPPISDAAVGMMISAINGDIRLLRIIPSKSTMVTRPRSASIAFLRTMEQRLSKRARLRALRDDHEGLSMSGRGAGYRA